jgi:hypothetical protein
MRCAFKKRDLEAKAKAKVYIAQGDFLDQGTLMIRAATPSRRIGRPGDGRPQGVIGFI